MHPAGRTDGTARRGKAEQRSPLVSLIKICAGVKTVKIYPPPPPPPLPRGVPVDVAWPGFGVRGSETIDKQGRPPTKTDAKKRRGDRIRVFIERGEYCCANRAVVLHSGASADRHTPETKT